MSCVCLVGGRTAKLDSRKFGRQREGFELFSGPLRLACRLGRRVPAGRACRGGTPLCRKGLGGGSGIKVPGSCRAPGTIPGHYLGKQIQGFSLPCRCDDLLLCRTAQSLDREASWRNNQLATRENSQHHIATRHWHTTHHQWSSLEHHRKAVMPDVGSRFLHTSPRAI